MALLVPLIQQIVVCGIPNNPALAWNMLTPAARVAIDVFGNDYQSCLTTNYETIDAAFKTLAAMPPGNGQLLLTPIQINAIKAFTQWVREEMRLGRDPSTVLFPVGDLVLLIERYKDHETFVKDWKINSKIDEPTPFTAKDKWHEWFPTFENYLRKAPGYRGVPLAYVVRENDEPDPTPQGDIMEMYIKMAPHSGPWYDRDKATVNSHFTRLCRGHPEAEPLLKIIIAQKDGRADYKFRKFQNVKNRT